MLDLGVYGLATDLALGYGVPSMAAPRLSASQVDTFLDCPRKWAWKYLEKIPDVPNHSAQLGTKVHSILEKWLEGGIYPDTQEVLVLQTPQGPKTYFPGQIAQAGLHLLPPPGVAHVEGEFKMESRETGWKGYRDARFIEDAQGQAWPPDPIVAQLPGHVPVVMDHKTTSDFKWMKSEEVLAKDVQANLYAAKTLEEMAVKEVLGRWVYYRTRGNPEARKVEVRFTLDHVAEQMVELDRTAKEIHHLYQVRPKAMEVPPNPDACDRYGGCPHISRCDLGVYERTVAIMAKETIQEMLERKRKEREAQEASGAPPIGTPPAPPANSGVGPFAPVPQAAPPAPPVAPQAPPSPPVPAAPPAAPPVPTGAPTDPGYWKPGDPMNPAQEWLQGQGKPWSVIASAADRPPPDHVAKAYDAGGFTEAGTINPPEAPKAAPPTPDHMPPVAPPAPPVQAPQAPAAPPAPGQDDLDGMSRDQLKAKAMEMGLVDSSSRLREDSLRTMIREARAKGQAAPPAPPAPPVQVPAAPQAPPAPPVPPPAPPVPPPAQSIQEAVQGVIPQAAPPAPPAPPQGRPQGRMGFILLVNSTLVRAEGWPDLDVVQFSDILQVVLERMTQDTGLADYRLEEYGKGPGRFASYVEGVVRELELGSATMLVVDSRTQEGGHALTTLERLAGVIIRGL